MTDMQEIFAPLIWYRPERGPRYTQLYRHIAALIRSGSLEAEAQLPPERDLAEMADVSRVTVRKAVAQLVEEGALEQRRGAGTFVRPQQQRLEQSLSNLISFTEHMQQRGKTSSSQVLQRGLYPPRPEEQMALGLALGLRVARIERLRFYRLRCWYSRCCWRSALRHQHALWGRRSCLNLLLRPGRWPLFL